MPLCDDRFLLAFENPVSDHHERKRADRQVNLAAGVWTINGERQKYGLPSVDGGD